MSSRNPIYKCSADGCTKPASRVIGQATYCNSCYEERLSE